MLNRLRTKIGYMLQIPVLEIDRVDFYYGIQKINNSRGKVTAATFLIIEAFLFILSLLLNKEKILEKPKIFYGIMYFLMALFMTVCLIIFHYEEKNISKNGKSISISGILFTSFILGWCTGISLLDLLSDGEVILYMIAIISIAVTPIVRPYILLIIYCINHIAFLVLLPQFHKADSHLVGICINSTTIIIVAWSISYMRYRNRAEDFVKNKKIRETTEELMRLNLELEEANHKLEIISQKDGLTGIYNRSVFDKIIRMEWKRCMKHKEHMALIMIDIDFFRAFNNNYGHQAGDICLKQVAEVLADCTERPSDAVIRYGGEEFAIILPFVKKELAQKMAEKIRFSVEELNIQHKFSSVSEYVTVSLGINAVIPKDELSIEDFIESVERVLYGERNNNRNKVIVA